jgi:predicted MPP superfamily phosphohydrolase
MLLWIEVEECVKTRIVEGKFEAIDFGIRTYTNYISLERKTIDDIDCCYRVNELDYDSEECKELKEEALKLLKERLREKAIKILKDIFAENEKIKSIIIGVGICIGFPYEYYWAYLLKLGEDYINLKPKEALEKAGEKPHTWGIGSGNSWGNYWFEKITEEDLEKLKENIDLDLATILISQAPETILELD